MTIKEFIKKAIEGGYLKEKNPKLFGGLEILSGEETDNWSIGWKNKEENCNDGMGIHKLVLDPKAWEAVGKVDGWKKIDTVICGIKKVEIETNENGYEQRMHEMIDHLIKGGSIETYLKTL